MNRIHRYYQILKNHPKPVKLVIARLLIKAGLSRLIRLQYDGFALRFYPTSLSQTLWMNPGDRDSDLRFFRSYLRPGDTVVDVGANIGSLTLCASAAVGSAGRVFAIEPNPALIKYLRGNIRLNGFSNISAHNVAVGASTDVLHLTQGNSDDMNYVTAQSDGIAVKVQPLDDLCDHVEEVALLKIDVEGYEEKVLLGARDTLAKTKCVYFESYEGYLCRQGSSCAQVFSLLREHGFRIFHYVGSETLVPMKTGHVSKRVESMVAVRDTVAFQERTGFCLDLFPPQGLVSVGVAGAKSQTE